MKWKIFMKVLHITGCILHIFFCTIMIAGCTLEHEETNRASMVTKIITTPTVQNSAASLAKTEIPRPTTTITKRPTYTPSRTPLPTLPSEESIKIIEEYLLTNSGCEFPCYWGIVPGKTKFEEVKTQLLPIAVDSGYGNRNPSKKEYSFFFLTPNDAVNERLMVTLFYDGKSGIIEMVTAGQEYAIKPFFENYGHPDQIYITEAYSSYGANPGVYTIQFYYPDKGILAGITGTSDYVKRADGNYTILCQELLQEKGRGTGFILWSPELFSSYSDVTNYLGYSTVKDKLLETATNMTNDEFYNMLIGKGTEKCLEIPMSYWGE